MAGNTTTLNWFKNKNKKYDDVPGGELAIRRAAGLDADAAAKVENIPQSLVRKHCLFDNARRNVAVAELRKHNSAMPIRAFGGAYTIARDSHWWTASTRSLRWDVNVQMLPLQLPPEEPVSNLPRMCERGRTHLLRQLTYEIPLPPGWTSVANSGAPLHRIRAAMEHILTVWHTCTQSIQCDC